MTLPTLSVTTTMTYTEEGGGSGSGGGGGGDCDCDCCGGERHDGGEQSSDEEVAKERWEATGEDVDSDEDWLAGHRRLLLSQWQCVRLRAPLPPGVRVSRADQCRVGERGEDGRWVGACAAGCGTTGGGASV